ncbi:MAG: hypothetical protein J2O39_07675, partial [Acidimicrobiales bacterium]|nr:hypothetical protein [Acidimicrobiales bacterium]
PVMLASGQKTPVAGHGVHKSQLGSVHVKGGRQATFEGHRLYWFVGDKAPGQVNGNFTDTWGKWVAATMVPAAASSSPASSSSSPASSSSSPASSSSGSGSSGSGSSGSGSSGSGSSSSGSSSNSGSGGASF